MFLHTLSRLLKMFNFFLSLLHRKLCRLCLSFAFLSVWTGITHIQAHMPTFWFVLRCRSLDTFFYFSPAVGLVAQNFTFVLTDVESKQRFGFCQLSDGAQSGYCFLRWDSVIYCGLMSSNNLINMWMLWFVHTVICHGLKCSIICWICWLTTLIKDR